MSGQAILFEPLEPRLLLDAVYPSAAEQYMLELVNRARANPNAEVARYDASYWDGTPDLNEGLAPATISADPKQPLALDPYLIDGGRVHSQWMIDNDVFQHEGEGGNSPGDRMAAAGYVFGSPSGWGENIGWKGTTGSYDLADFVYEIEANLFCDAGIAGRGHRLSLMNGDFREVGVGIIEGIFTDGGTDYNAVMATQDFAYSGTDLFLTGVVYDDSLVTDDDFYTPGEGLDAITITAVREPDGHTTTTTTWAAGGYSMVLAPGTYTVTATGAGLGTVTEHGVLISDENVKQDFTPDMTSTTTASVPRITMQGYGTDLAAADLLYSQMHVQTAVNGTYYCAIDSGSAELGLVAHAGSGDREVFVSVLDGSEPTVLWTASGADALRFVGAESGYAVYFPFAWTTAATYSFALKIEHLGSATRYDALFYDPVGGDWQTVATLSRPVENDAFAAFGSYVEDIAGTPGTARTALVGNTWLRKAGPTWVETTAGLYTTTGVETEVDGDVVGATWRLETGGGTVNDTASGTTLNRGAGVQPAGTDPTLSYVAPFTDGIEDIAYRFTYAALSAAANEADVDGDALSFRVEAVSSGALTKDGVAVTPGATLLAADESWVWTPPADRFGSVEAFTIVVSDGGAVSSSAVAVNVELATIADDGWDYIAQFGGTDNQIHDIAVHPTDPQTLYLATRGGVYGSTDGGTTWTQLHDGHDREIEVDPTDPDTLYTGPFTPSGYGLYKSADGGTSWTLYNTGMTEAYFDSLGVAAGSTNILFAGGYTDGKIQKSTDGGESWAEVFDVQTYLATAENVYLKDLAVSANGQTVYVLACEKYYNTGYLMKTSNGGTDWTQLSPPLDGWGNAIALDAGDADTFFLGTALGLYRTTNGGTGWTKLTTGLGASATIDAVVVAPGDSNLVYCVADDTPYVSVDGGDSWTQAGSAFREDTYELGVASSDFRAVFAASAAFSPPADPGPYEGLYRLNGTGSASGSVWNDIDNDGLWDGDEPGLEGWTVFIDLDGDGVLDPGETSTTSDGAGAYAFTGLQPGAYTVVEDVRAGWQQTAPAGDGTWADTLTYSQSVAARDFGNHNDDVALIALDWNAAEGVEEVMRLDPATGTQTVIGEVGDLHWWHGQSVFDSGTNRLYIAGISTGGADKLYTVDAPSGGLINEVPLDRSELYLAGVDAGGDLIALNWDAVNGTEDVCRLDPDTGELTELGQAGDLMWWLGQCAVDPAAGLLYAIGWADGGSAKLYTFNLAGGTVTAQPAVAHAELYLAGLAGSGDLIALGWNAGEGVEEVYRLNPATGALTELAELDDLMWWQGQPSLDVAGNALYVTGRPDGGSFTLYSVDLGTGAVSSAHTFAADFDAFVSHRPATADVTGAIKLHKGVSLPLWNENVNLADLRQSLADMVTAGVTYVAVNVFWFQENINSTVIAADFSLYSAADATVELVIDEIHAQGMAVMLKPLVNLSDDSEHWRGEIVGSETWFTGTDGYGDLINHFADMAEAKGAELLCVGTELVATASEDARWRTVIAGARARFSGELTYAANHGGEGAATQAAITWWDALDYAGIDAYYPLTDEDDPTVTQLRAAWAAHAQTIETWRTALDVGDRKPILFTEIGYRSWDGANKNPTEMSSKDDTNVDQGEQADCYTATFEELWGKKGWLRGLYWWNWEVDPTPTW